MKSKIFIIGITIILSFLGFFVINYFTLFGYYLPHTPHLIEVHYPDTAVTDKPAYIGIPTTPDGGWVLTNDSTDNIQITITTTK